MLSIQGGQRSWHGMASSAAGRCAPRHPHCQGAQHRPRQKALPPALHVTSGCSAQRRPVYLQATTWRRVQRGGRARPAPPTSTGRCAHRRSTRLAAARAPSPPFPHCHVGSKGMEHEGTSEEQKKKNKEKKEETSKVGRERRRNRTGNGKEDAEYEKREKRRRMRRTRRKTRQGR